MNKDYVFNINWEDEEKQLHRIGFLAQLDGSFYLIIKNEENAKIAYDNGFIGIPGFKLQEVYKSEELFDFFKNRILQKSNSNPCEELAETGAKSMVDNYSVSQISDKISLKYKKLILAAYDLQEQKANIQKCGIIKKNDCKICDK